MCQVHNIETAYHICFFIYFFFLAVMVEFARFQAATFRNYLLLGASICTPQFALCTPHIIIIFLTNLNYLFNFYCSKNTLAIKLLIFFVDMTQVLCTHPSSQNLIRSLHNHVPRFYAYALQFAQVILIISFFFFRFLLFNYFPIFIFLSYTQHRVHTTQQKLQVPTKITHIQKLKL